MIALCKKEITEGIATYKALILLAVFVALGIINPLTAKLMPTILASVTTPEIAAQFGEPTALDAWAQFFKNVPQLGLIVFIIAMSTIVSKEKPYLPLLVTHRFKRSQIIHAKALYLLGLWTICYSVSAIITWGYTAYYWDMSAVHDLPLQLFGVYLFGAAMWLVVFVGNTIGGTAASGLLAGFVVFSSLLLIQALYPSEYNPVHLLAVHERLAGATSSLVPAMLITISSSLVLYGAALQNYKKKAL